MCCCSSGSKFWIGARKEPAEANSGRFFFYVEINPNLIEKENAEI